MKKNKLVIDYEFNFELIGILTQVKEYKLAWTINQTLNIHLKKCEDFVIQFLNNKSLTISNYLFKTGRSKIRLLKNKSYEKNENNELYLLPEIRQFDYLLQIYNEGDSFDSKMIREKLAENIFIDYITPIELDKLKSKDNLIF